MAGAAAAGDQAAAAGAAGAAAGQAPAAGGAGAAGGDGKTGDQAAAGQQPPAAAAGDGKAGQQAAAGQQQEPPARVVPDKYTLKVPEAARDYLDDSDVATVSAMAKEHKLTNEEAQQVLEQEATRIAAQSASFRARLDADTVFGGEKITETQRLGNAVLDRFAPTTDPLGKEIRQVLVKSGFGNHLAIVAFLAKIGRAMAEDAPSGGRTGEGRTSGDAAAVLYDHPDSKALRSA
jgi:hypothetical protein